MEPTLAEQRCVPCEGGVPALSERDAAALLEELGGGWTMVDAHHIQKGFRFPDYRQVLAFVAKVGELAEEEGHHPDIHLEWGKVGIKLWTHAAFGLHRNDFVLAAKIDRL